MRKQLLVESIRIDGQTQSREKISEQTVIEYAEAMKANTGAPFPALIVFFDGTDYWLADGFHRLLAAQRIGRKNIAAEVKEGSRKDAAWAACAANQFHGLRRTNPDKRKCVTMALKLRPEKSDRLLADHCGVWNTFVGDVRRELVKAAGSPPPSSRVGKDGKTYASPSSKTQVVDSQGFKVGLNPTCPSPGPEERSETGAKSAVPAQGPAPAAKEASPQADIPTHSTSSGQVDGVGRRIPEDRLELWNRGGEVQELLSAISSVRVALRKAQASRDPLFAEVSYSSTLIHLDAAYSSVQVTKPYAVCAYCQGHGCKACGQRGLVGKWRWDLLPAELKKEIERLVKQGGGKDE